MLPCARIFKRGLRTLRSLIRNAVVEFWQVDGKGVYLHSGSNGKTGRDANFQGFGRFLTSSTGEYNFRTIIPGADWYRAMSPATHPFYSDPCGPVD